MGGCISKGEGKRSKGKRRCDDDANSQATIAPGQYALEQGVIDNTVMKSGKVTHCAIVGMDGGIRAWAPSDFHPEQQGIDDIIDAFKGNVDGLAERGIELGCGVNCSVPGKIDEGHAIYGNDGKKGGSSVFKANECMIIMVFRANPMQANRLGMEMGDYLRDKGL